MSTRIAHAAAGLSAAIEQLVEAFSTPLPAAEFRAHVGVIIEIEKAFNAKSLIDACVAKSAEQAMAGDLVGSSSFVDFLILKLDLSRAEAMRRVRLAQQHFGEITDPAPTTDSPSDGDGAGGETEQQRRGREQREHHQRQQRIQEEEKRRQQARDKARHARISAEKQAVIDAELRHLNHGVSPTRQQLYLEAVYQATTRSVEDLRRWVRDKVTAANRSSSDPFAAWRKRGIHIGAVDADGAARIHGYLPPAVIALLDVALAPARRPGYGHDVASDTDRRSLAQRRADAFAEVLRTHSQKVTAAQGGVGSIVVSLSHKDLIGLENLPVTTRFASNTRAHLNIYDMLVLGAAACDMAVLLDPESGNPLIAGRTRRTANLEQRLALFASQLVCTHPGCDRVLIECDVHHLISWLRCGRTDIDNLTLLCRHHHGDNDDSRTRHRRRGFATKDPHTGRVGYQPPTPPHQPPPPITVNDSAAQQHSAGATTRKQPWPPTPPQQPRSHPPPQHNPTLF